MSEFRQEEFNNFILDNNVIGFFEEPVQLKSGRFSSWYVNWRTVSEDVYLCERLSEYVIAFTQDLGFELDCFYGVPEGATKLGLAVQTNYAKKSPDYGPGSHTLSMGRGKPKSHGVPKDKYFVGQPKGDTIVLEDVTTTGGSLLEEIAKLKENDTILDAAIALTNRMEKTDKGVSVKRVIESAGVPYFAMSDAHELLPEAYGHEQPGELVRRNLEHEFRCYGVKPLVLK